MQVQRCEGASEGERQDDRTTGRPTRRWSADGGNVSLHVMSNTYVIYVYVEDLDYMNWGDLAPKVACRRILNDRFKYITP